MTREFYSALAKPGHWHFVPLHISRGRLSHNVHDHDRFVESTKGNHAFMLYLAGHSLTTDLDAVVACISEESTLIAHVRRNPCGVDIDEAVETESWKRRVTDQWAVAAHQYVG